MMVRSGHNIVWLPSLVLSLLTAISSDAWLTIQHNNNGLHRSRKPLLSAHIQDERYPRGEVIGSTGKIGSYILNSINSPVVVPIESINPYPQCQPAAATPRGVSPGCLSPEGTPIYACIPTKLLHRNRSRY